MNDKKQNIDSKERLLDALDASGITDENLKELLSDPDNVLFWRIPRYGVNRKLHGRISCISKK